MSRVVVDELDVFPFDHFHVLFPNHSFTMIAGSNRSGKTVLAKCLAGHILTKKKIMIQKTYLENINIKESGRSVVVFFEDNVSSFLGKSVNEQLQFSMDFKQSDESFIHKKLKDVISTFSLQKYLRMDPNKLDYFMKIKLYLASLLINDPEALILDDPTKRLTRGQRKELLSILNHYQSLGMTIILITSSLEDALFANVSRVCILHQGAFVLEGNKNDVLKEDSLLSKVGLALPFMVDLSVKLQYYNLVDKMILDQESLVEYLWK